jgi:hypothetical protein
MGRGKSIEDYVEQYVLRRASKDRKTPRDKLADNLTVELRKLGKTPPAKDTLKKMISGERNREPFPEDQPWSMGTLKEYRRSPEAIAAIMEAYRFAVEHNGKLTIRQAKWIEHLSEVPRRMFPEGPNEKALTALLIIWACQYAQQEIWSELTKKPLITTGLDHSIAMRHVGPVDQWETLAAFLLLEQPTESELLPGEEVDSRPQIAIMNEWTSRPMNKRSLERQDKIDKILRRMSDSPELANDATLKAQLASLVDEETHKLEREEPEPDDSDRVMDRMKEENPKLYRQVSKALEKGEEDEVHRLLAPFMGAESFRSNKAKREGR